MRCRQWICRACAVQKGGSFFCRDGCADPASAREQTAPPPPAPAKDPAPRAQKTAGRFPVLLLLSLISLGIGLGGAAFGFYQYRKAAALQERVTLYRTHRARMISFIRKRNTAYRELKRIVDNQAVWRDTAKAAPGREAIVAEEPRAYEYSSLRLPFSFDNGATDKKLVAVTFDGGGHANVAEEILDTLRSRGVRATMFLTGGFIRKNTALVRRIVEEGHEVGNHTATHPHLTSWQTSGTHTTLPGITFEMIGRELESANRAFQKLTGAAMQPLWRAPYGETNRQICLWAQEHGYLHIGWKQARRWKNNHDTNDWVPDPETPGYYTPQQVLDKFAKLADAQPYGMNGAIILMHLGTIRKEKHERIHYALGAILDLLRDKGYELVTVSVLLKDAGVDLSLLQQRGSGDE